HGQVAAVLGLLQTRDRDRDVELLPIPLRSRDLVRGRHTEGFISPVGATVGVGRVDQGLDQLGSAGCWLRSPGQVLEQRKFVEYLILKRLDKVATRCCSQRVVVQGHFLFNLRYPETKRPRFPSAAASFTASSKSLGTRRLLGPAPLGLPFSVCPAT